MTDDRIPLAVVGAGPAGLEAAATAAEHGVEVLLVDAYARPGGQYYRQLPAAFRAEERTPRRREAEALTRRLTDPRIRCLSDTVAWGVFPMGDGQGWELALHGPDAPAVVSARCLILAPGAYDRPLPFPGWTLPGVMTAGAVQSLIENQRVLPGRRFLLSGAGPLQLAVAAALIRSGAQVAAVLEGARFGRGLARHAPAVWGQWARLAEAWDYARVLRSARTPVRTGWSVIAAHGEDQVEAATIARLDRDWRPIPGTEQQVEADSIVLGYGFVPSTGLSRLAGCELVYRPELGGHVPVRDAEMQASLPGIYVAGDGAGIAGAGSARIEGRIAAFAAVRRLAKIPGKRAGLDDAAAGRALAREQARLARERRFARMLAAAFTPGPGLVTLPTDDTVICRCEEVTLGQIKAAVADGAGTVNEVKGLTCAGMGNCQGRICGTLLPPLIAAELARTGQPLPGAPELLTVRPPIHPLPLSALAAMAAPDPPTASVQRDAAS